MGSVPVLLTPAEAAARLHISERTLRDLKRDGVIRYIAVTGKRICYREDDLAEFLDSRLRQDERVDTAPPSKRRRPGVVVPFSKRSRA